MIVVTINGKERELDAPTNLVSYLEQLGVAERRLAVAYNGVVLQKQELAGVTISQGDQLEIVRAVGEGRDVGHTLDRAAGGVEDAQLALGASIPLPTKRQCG